MMERIIETINGRDVVWTDSFPNVFCCPQCGSEARKRRCVSQREIETHCMNPDCGWIGK